MLVGAGLRKFGARPWMAAVVVSVIVASTTTMVAGAGVVSARGFTCSSGAAVYQVVPGDSWFAIASRTSTSASSLTGVNDASLDDLLVPGDELCLPADADLTATCATYRVEQGDSWFGIAAAIEASASSLLSVNGTTIARTLHPGDVLCLPAGASGGTTSRSSSSAAAAAERYTVARGDSWAGIAARSGVSMRALLDVNDATVADVLHPGDALRLPAGATPPAAPVSVTLDAAPTQGPCGYADTWGDARSPDRRHLGVDIFSGSGNYVYAAVDGRLTGRVWDGAGRNAGNAWTLTGRDGTRFFYAHLADFAPELRVGSTVRAGQIIGWIGATGNASAAHLHFEVRPRGGTPVNPYPILRAQGQGCNDGQPYTQPGGWVPERLR